MGNTKIIPRGFGPALVLVLLAGVVGGLGQWWADGGSQAVQLARCGALLAEAWEAAAVEEVLFRGGCCGHACLGRVAGMKHTQEEHCAPIGSPAYALSLIPSVSR